MGAIKKDKAIVWGSRQPQSKPIAGISVLTVSVLFFVALVDYNPSQSMYITTHPTQNIVGALGSEWCYWALYTLGASCWLIPLIGFWFAYKCMFKQAHTLTKWKYISALTVIVTTSALLTLLTHQGMNVQPSNYFGCGKGGIIGKWIFLDGMKHILGTTGSSIILGVVEWLSTCMLLLPASHPTQAWEIFTESLKNYYLGYKQSLQAKSFQVNIQPKKEISTINTQNTITLRDIVSQQQAEPIMLPPIKKTQEVIIEKPVTQEIITKNNSKLKAPEKTTLKIIQEEKVEKVHNVVPQKKGNYLFPSLNLLGMAPSSVGITSENHQAMMEALIATLKQFGIEASPGEVHAGPVITRYELIPAPGVRVEKIANLDKNIAMALRAISVRIIAPVPGKGCVGIEIPNAHPMPVCLREIIESKAWVDANAEIPLVLGKEVTGKPLVADLTKMPHLLIAGATGAGKTVCINAIIASLLYRASPEDLRFLMVDPKIVEMQLYNALPHMLIPVVTDPKKVPGALKWLISEMERRYQIFAKVGVRNIAGFNAKILKNQEEKIKAQELDAALSPEERAAVSMLEVDKDEKIQIPKEKIPYIVCIVDELADLMMVAPADIETCIARLAQLARAAGIHLIIATQRPSVNVITGVIKANLPSRIAFKVASKVDSRTILDGNGADALIGRGDMLFIPPGSAHLLRAQGAFVSDEEIHSIVEFLKVNGEPQFEQAIQKQIDSGDDSSSEKQDWEDALIPEALDIIRNSQKASASLLQRRLRIGYNRAARIMDILEAEGYVGGENGSNAREVLERD